MRKIGINMHAMHGLTDEEYIRTISELGFNTTFSSAFEPKRQEQVANLLAKCNIEYEALHSPYDHINDMWLDSEGGERMLAELQNCVDHCVIASAPMMIVHVSSGATPPPIIDVARVRFEKLVEYAIKHNVKIAFENLRKNAHFAWVMELFANEPMVGFCWDCGHESCHQYDSEIMPIYGERLICTHIHDNCGLKEADDHLLPFDGIIDFNRFAEYIRNCGYTGSFMLEVFNQVHRYDDLTTEQFLEKAAVVVKKLVKMTDEC